MKRKFKLLKTLKYVIACTFTVGTLTIAVSENPYDADGGYPTYEEAMKEDKIWLEMEAAGYSDKQIWDQIFEEVYHVDGECGTGGKDGLLLNGTPAPNASGGGVSTSTPKCDHSYKSEVTKEATCTEAGTTTYTCEKCGKTYTEKIPKIDHDFEITEEVTGTCLEKGYRVETCKVCGLTQTIEGIYGDHDLWVNGEQVEPTCTEPGLKTEQCKLCFEVFTTELPSLGHEFETTPTVDREPACVMSGEQSNHCIRCEERTNITKIPALGHDPVTEEKKAGLFTNGYVKTYCTRCGQVNNEKILYSFVSTYKPYVISGVILILAVIGILIARSKRKSK